MDGDGQLTFDEFKVLFANADKRKKDTQKKLDTEGQQSVKVMETTDQWSWSGSDLLKGSKSSTPDQKGQTPKKKNLPANLGQLSLRSPTPTKLAAGGQGKEANRRSRKMSIA